MLLRTLLYGHRKLAACFPENPRKSFVKSVEYEMNVISEKIYHNTLNKFSENPRRIPGKLCASFTNNTPVETEHSEAELLHNDTLF